MAYRVATPLYDSFFHLGKPASLGVSRRLFGVSPSVSKHPAFFPLAHGNAGQEEITAFDTS
jgi:hypothetical protein